MSIAQFAIEGGLSQALPVIANRWLQYKPQIVLLGDAGFHNLGLLTRGVTRVGDVSVRGGCFEFPGANGYIDLGAGGLVTHAAHTLVAVCQIDSFPSAYPILASYATSSTRVSCFFSTDPLYADFSIGTTGGGFTARCALTGSGPVLGTRRSIVVVRSADTSAGHAFFVNGTKIATQTSSAHGARSGNSVLGQAETTNLSFDFDGRIHLFVLFDAILPEALARELSGNPGALFDDEDEFSVFAEGVGGGATTKTIVTSLSAAIQQAYTATATISAGIQANASTTATVNAVVQAAQAAQASLDAALQRVNQATAGLDAAVTASGTRVASLDTAVQLARSATTALNAALQAQRSATATVSAQVQAPGSVTTSLNAFIQAGSQVNVSISAAILAAALRTAGIDAVVTQGQTRTAALNAALRQARSATAAIGAAVGMTRVATTSLNAQIQIAGATNVIAGIDAAVQRLTGAVVSLDAMISAAGFANAALNAVVSLQRSAAAAMSAAVLNTRSVVASLSAFISVSGEVPPALHLLVTISLEQELRSIVGAPVNQIDVTLSLDPSLGRVFVP